MDDRRELPLFLCYRQIDGSEVASWLYSHIHGRVTDESGEGARLHVYFDQYAPATGDWTAIHKHSLERSRALVLICTPGVYAPSSDDDWVHMELNWWVRHRKTAPIVIDATGEGERWLPTIIRQKWPNIQRIVLKPDLLREEANSADRVIHRIIEGIRCSEAKVLFEDVQEHKRLLRRSKTVSIATALIAGLALLGLVLVLRLNHDLSRSNERLDKAVERAEAAARAAGKTAEANAVILEVLYGRNIRVGKVNDGEAQRAWNAVQDALKELRATSSDLQDK